MNNIKAIAICIATTLVWVPMTVIVLALSAIWYLIGGFIIYLLYLCIDTVNTIFGGDPEQFWIRNYKGLDKLRKHMINAINIWFN